MARKINPPRPDPQMPAAGDPPAAEQLAELVPNLPITIAGRELVIREYGAFEGLEVAAQAAPLIDAMAEIARERELTYTDVRRLVGRYPAESVAIAARAAGVEPEWVRGLDRDDLDTFLSSWFGVNTGFFVHEVVERMRDEMMRKLMTGQRRAGTTSSSASPTPDSATSTGSGA